GTCSGLVVCKPGLLLPVWTPLNPSPGQQAGRAVVYFLGLIYLFLGVSIIADRFMASIEVITSQEKEVTLTGPGGAPLVRRVRVWNETVSNLTLMALGSSAPEILLSVIEAAQMCPSQVCGHGFAAGALGPGTIVGSAAFNMLVIVGVCVLVVPDGETRRIQRLPVYLLTASWSVLAYVWLYLILAVSSPGIVEVLLMPDAVPLEDTVLWTNNGCFTRSGRPRSHTSISQIFVLLAWLTDRRLLSFTRLPPAPPQRRETRHRGGDGGRPGDGGRGRSRGGRAACGGVPWWDASCSHRPTSQVFKVSKQVLAVLRDLRLRHPDKDLDQLTHMAAYWVLQRQRRSRAFYRVQVTRMLTGSGNVLRNYCMENCGAVCLGVSLTGGTGRDTFLVDYCTENGSARAGADYGFRSGTLVFGPGEGRQEIQVDVLDDEVFEEDKHFFVRLQNLRLGEDGCEGTGSPPRARLAEPLACVTILDDDHAGVFVFGQQVLRRDESGDTLTVAVLRNSGSRGPVALAYRTEDSSAAAGRGLPAEPGAPPRKFPLWRSRLGGALENRRVAPGFLGAPPRWPLCRGSLQALMLPSLIRRGSLAQDPRRGAELAPGQTLKVQISRVEPREEQRSFFIVLEEPRWQQEDASGGSSLDQEDAGRLSEPGKPVLGERSRLEVVLDPSPELRVTPTTRAGSAVRTSPGSPSGVVTGHRGHTGERHQPGPGDGHPLLEGAVCPSALRRRSSRAGRRGRGAAGSRPHGLLPALPVPLLEGGVCLHPAHPVLERLGLLLRVGGRHRPPHGLDRGPGLPLRLHRGPPGQCHGPGVRGARHLPSRQACAAGVEVWSNWCAASAVDTFASKVAATQDRHADACVGNVTGSNSVNVFLGIGVAWTVAALYWHSRGEHFRVEPGSLAFSVTLFTVFALLAMAVLWLRRRSSVGGELGGPRGPKVLTALLFFGLWLLYVLLSSLEAYCHLRGF
ncbi:unnamed protein product, partial [Tetraodon nigroviridis]